MDMIDVLFLYIMILLIILLICAIVAKISKRLNTSQEKQSLDYQQPIVIDTSAA